MLQGHSRARIEVVEMPDGYYVKKYGCGVDASILKQQLYANQFADSALNNIIGIPETIFTGVDYAVMEFINGKSILDVITSSDAIDLNYCVESIMSLIKWELSLSHDVMMPKEQVCVKFNGSIKEIGHVVPYGPCHGDLTLANIIFNRKLYLIDFLPNFIESPLWDIAKIFQEVNLKWSYITNPKYGDTTKINIAYSYLRTRFNEAICQLNLDEEVVNYFYYMTLNRVEPYTTEKKVKQILLEEIKRCEP